MWVARLPWCEDLSGKAGALHGHRRPCSGVIRAKPDFAARYFASPGRTLAGVACVALAVEKGRQADTHFTHRLAAVLLASDECARPSVAKLSAEELQNFGQKKKSKGKGKGRRVLAPIPAASNSNCKDGVSDAGAAGLLALTFPPQEPEVLI